MAPTEGDPPQRSSSSAATTPTARSWPARSPPSWRRAAPRPSSSSYPSRRVELSAEGAQVAAADADAVVAIAVGEAPRLLAAMIDAGVPGRPHRRPRRHERPADRRADVPEDPARLDGLTVIATTGDRAFASRLATVPASQDQVSYGAQMYDCAVHAGARRRRRRLRRPGGDRPADPCGDVGRTDVLQRSPTAWPCSPPNEDIDFDGATGGIAIDEHGDVTTARITTLRVTERRSQEVASEDVDLVALARQDVYASALFTAQVQQTLRLLGLYDGRGHRCVGPGHDRRRARPAAPAGRARDRPVGRGDRRRLPGPLRRPRRRLVDVDRRRCRSASPSSACTTARSTGGGARSCPKPCGRCSASSACRRPA